MKRLLQISFFCTILNSSHSQVVTPSPTGEFCPNTEYTFTVSILKAFQSIIGNGGCSVTQQPLAPVGSTFTFKGKFGDVNQKQFFRVNYTDATSNDIEFKKIKSLFYTTSCAQVPNQAVVVVPRCQIVNIPINFNNVQWGTNFETPTLCFGSIVDYEYRLPTNWSIGGQVSTGSNWIPANNSVVVTSDGSNGVNGAILIRPRNNCVSGLQNGQIIGQVPISRPEPNLSVNQTPAILCSGSENYTITGMPSGSTVLWSIDDSSDASISNITSPTVTLTRTSVANTVVKLTATVTHCTFSYTRIVSVALGTGFNTVNYEMMNVTCEGRRAYFYENVQEVLGATNYAWYAKDMIDPNNPFVLKESGYGYNHIDFPLGASNCYYTVYVLVSTPCGDIQSNLGEGYFFAPSCTGDDERMSVSPNPAKNNVVIKVPDNDSENKLRKNFGSLEVQISDKLGKVYLKRRISSLQKTISLDISLLKPDIYFIKIWDGAKWRMAQLIKQ